MLLRLPTDYMNQKILATRMTSQVLWRLLPGVVGGLIKYNELNLSARPKKIMNTARDRYVLKHVTPSYISDAVHTRGQIPRVTQTNLAKYAVPVVTKDGVSTASPPSKPNDSVSAMHPSCLKKLSFEVKQFWVDPQAINSSFMHKLNRIINTKTEPFNPTLGCQPQLFPRSYKYELRCIKEERRKTRKSEPVRLKEAESDAADEFKMPNLCVKNQPERWKTKIENEHCGFKEVTQNIAEKQNEIQDGYKRWRPKIIDKDTSYMSYNERLEEMRKVKQPFQTEACNFYYKYHPTRKFTKIENDPVKLFPVWKLGNL